MVAEAVKTARPGQWIRGRGWHQEKWTAPPSPNVEGFPTHASLDRVSPDNPVVLTHASGHASFVERQGDGGVWPDTEDAEPGGWRSVEGRERRADRIAPREGVRLDQGAGIERGRPARARPQDPGARGSRSALQRGHQLSGRWIVVRNDRPDEADGGRRRHGGAALGHGAGGQRGGGPEVSRSTG